MNGTGTVYTYWAVRLGEPDYMESLLAERDDAPMSDAEYIRMRAWADAQGYGPIRTSKVELGGPTNWAETVNV